MRDDFNDLPEHVQELSRRMAEEERLTMIDAILMDGMISAFGEAMAVRLGLRDGRDYFSMLLDRAILREIEALNFVFRDVTVPPAPPAEPDPQLELDLDDDIPF